MLSFILPDLVIFLGALLFPVSLSYRLVSCHFSLSALFSTSCGADGLNIVFQLLFI